MLCFAAGGARRIIAAGVAKGDATTDRCYNLRGVAVTAAWPDSTCPFDGAEVFDFENVFQEDTLRHWLYGAKL